MSLEHDEEKVISGHDKVIVINDWEANYEFYQIYKNHFYGMTNGKAVYADFKMKIEWNNVLYLSSSYYVSNGIEAIDVINEVMDYYDGRLPNREVGIVWNILKYLLRYPFKGQKESDIDKIIDYAKRLKKTIRN